MTFREYVCAACKKTIFTLEQEPRTICHQCEAVAEVNSLGPMTPEEEAALREILDEVQPISRKKSDA